MLTPENAHYRMPRRSRTVLVGVLALVLVVLAGLWWNAMGNQHRAEAAKTVAEQRADQRDAALLALQKRSSALLKANLRLLAHGQKPVHVPNVTPPSGPVGPEGPSGPSPTRAQVFAAVAEFCAGGACSQGPSESQVETAVLTYCAARDQCRGPTGTGRIGPAGAAGPPGGNGTNGTNGADGQPGQPGQNATDAQVQSAVNDYCSNHNQCQGPEGGQGPKGDPGTAQPGTYTCPVPTPFLHGLTIAADGTLTLDCLDLYGQSGRR